MSNWNVYYWKAGRQFLVGNSRQIIDLMGNGSMFTVRYTRSKIPKTLTYICKLSVFHKMVRRTVFDSEVIDKKENYGRS